MSYIIISLIIIVVVIVIGSLKNIGDGSSVVSFKHSFKFIAQLQELFCFSQDGGMEDDYVYAKVSVTIENKEVVSRCKLKLMLLIIC